MILIDTSVWIDYFNGVDTPQAERLDAMLSTEIIAAGDLIVAELLQGFRSNKDFQTAKTLLANLEQVQLCNADIAVKAAHNYRYLRKQGMTIRKTIDCIIATFCIENEMVLLHSDRDFEPFEHCLNLKSALKL